ncbi:MAG: hypothetical protein LBP59_11280 [Planctomycetaceae bacterium]|jgi:hypothetical protein|nr:hypothetical protein [Planctomycetaceae bacterium]
MQIAKSKVVNLFITLGCLKASKWSNDVLAERVASLPELFEPQMMINDKYQELFEDIYELVTKGQEITVLDDSDAPVEELLPSIDRNIRMKPPVIEPVDIAKLSQMKQKTKENITPQVTQKQKTIETSKTIGQIEPSKPIDSTKLSTKNKSVQDEQAANNLSADPSTESVQNDSQVDIANRNNNEPVDEVLEQFNNLDLTRIAKLVNDEEAKHIEKMKKKQAENKTDASDKPKRTRTKNTQESLLARQIHKEDWSDVMSPYGTWRWLSRYPLDIFFAEGHSGTLEQIMQALNFTERSAQRHLGELLRTGIIVFDEKLQVFRTATRDERIQFIDNGAHKTFKPFCAVAIREWMAKRKHGDI